MKKEIQPKVVSDWDGTVTDVYSRKKTYIDPYVEKLAQKLEMDRSELGELITQAEKVVIGRPERFGWEVNGVVVSAATDTFLITQAATKKVLDELGKGEGEGGLLNSLHQYGRSMMDLVFQPGVGEFLDELMRKGGVAIVTNSETLQVETELQQLMGDKNHGIKVVGGAKKYNVDKGWDYKVAGLDFSWVKPGNYSRPIYLQRPNYWGILTDLKGVKLVIGDMSELDLALPEAMGISTALKKSPSTPYWELQWYGSVEGKKAMINGYANALEVLGEML